MKEKSTGSALPVALIMLMVLTILGIAGLRMADTELKIAGAVQQFTTAFFAAESAIEHSIATEPLFDGMTNISVDVEISEDIAGQAVTDYLSSGPVPGGGYSIANNTYAAYHFEVIGEGKAPDNTSITVTQGIYLVARGSN